MLRRFLCVIVLLFSSCVFADDEELPNTWVGDCDLVWNDELGNWFIVCNLQGKPEQNFGCMDHDNCTNIVNQLLAAIERAINACGAAKDAVDQSFADMENVNIPNIVSTITGIVNQYRYDIGDMNADNILGLLYNLSVANTNILNRLEYAHNLCVGAEAECIEARNSLSLINCNAGSSGGDSGSCGDGSCPCKEEFDNVLDAFNVANRRLMTISEDTADIISKQIQYINIASNAYLSLVAITNRFNAPDDRMWDEMDGIYSNLLHAVSEIRHKSIDFSTLFYTIRQALRGEDGQDEPLKLSTEGVVMLYQSAFQAASQALQIQAMSDFDHAVKYFSNTVSRFFHQYSDLTLGKSNILPTSDQYEKIYNVFTNDSLHARGRYSWLTQFRQAGITNWFQRMELYQQAQLGWFAALSTPMDEEQENLTESNLEQQMLNTTNSLGAIVSASGGVSNSIESVFTPISQAFDGVEIVASMPTLITFLPEIEIGDFGELGPIQLDTTEIQDYCDVARRVTTLVWRILIWSLYVGLAVAVGRLLFILVLYLIHFIQNL